MLNLPSIPNQNELIAAMRKNQMIFAALFGSRANGTANPQSDYDFIVEFNPQAKVGLFKFIDAKNSLEKVVHAPVDLVTTKGISPHMKTEVFNTMKIIYDDRR